MSIPVREFVVKTLENMNFETAEVTDETPLGEGGVELESLAAAELVMQIEEEYGVSFSDEDVEGLQTISIGAFVTQVETLIGQNAAAESA